MRAAQPALVPDRPRPFLKWAGGKTQLLPHLLPSLGPVPQRYYEPFLGGGAVFFSLRPARATLSDANLELIETYCAIRDAVEDVIELLRLHKPCREHFYRVRTQDTGGLLPVQRAARLIYLNRTCYNGLYRVNGRGLFNVPYGSYQNPRICDADNLRRVAAALRRVVLRHRSVFSLGRTVRRGDVIYFDPPYDGSAAPGGAFTQYCAARFGAEEQTRLRDLFARLAARGAHVVLSNADTPFVRQLYRGFEVRAVQARRSINARGQGRGPVGEVIVTAQKTPASLSVL